MLKEEDYVSLPAGEFSMGRADTQKDCPEMRVRLTRGFRISRYPITQAQWLEVMDNRPWQSEKVAHRIAIREGARFPAVGVDWHEANRFAEELSRVCKAGLFLPTEAQWEYAIRAGSSSLFFWGDEQSQAADYGWFRKRGESSSDPNVHLREVGLLKPNPWGLFDMTGNISEWVRDRCDVSPGSVYIEEAHYPAESADFFHESGKYGISRNGDYRMREGCMASHYKITRELTERSAGLGFRLVMEG